jgi:hypothetical protein
VVLESIDLLLQSPITCLESLNTLLRISNLEFQAHHRNINQGSERVKI